MSKHVPGGKTGVFKVRCPVCSRRYNTRQPEIEFCSPECMAKHRYPGAEPTDHRKHRVSVDKSEYDPEGVEKARLARIKALEDVAFAPY